MNGKLKPRIALIIASAAIAGAAFTPVAMARVPNDADNRPPMNASVISVDVWEHAARR